MKKTFLSSFFSVLLFALSLNSAFAGDGGPGLLAGDKVPDVLVEGKLDSQSGAYLIDRIRILLINTGFSDPFNRLIPGKYFASYSVVPDTVDTDAKKYIDGIGELIGMDVTKSRFVITVDDFAYEVGLVSTDIRPTQDAEKQFVAKTRLGLQDIGVGAKKISVALKMVPRGSPAIPDECFLPNEGGTTEGAIKCTPFRDVIVKIFDVSLVQPSIETKKSLQLPVTFDVSVRPAETLKLKMIDSGFSELRQILKNTPDAIVLSQLNFEGTPDVSINIGTRKVTVDSQKIEDYIKSQSANIKKVMIDQLVSSLQDGFGNKELNSLLDSSKIQNDLWFGASIYTGFQITQISPSIENQFSASLSSGICSITEYMNIGAKCMDLQTKVDPVRDISDTDIKHSKDAMKVELSNRNANLAMSVSEHFVNKILNKSVEMNLWADALKGTGIQFGPKKTFVVFDDPNSTDGTLFIDAVYPLPRKYRILFGTKYLRFAMIYKVNMYFKNSFIAGENVPIFIVKVTGADLSRKKLVGGIPNYTDYKGRLGGFFKRKVTKIIQKEGGKLVGREVLAFDLPVLKNLGLEKAKFRSDGHGRIMGSINVNSSTLLFKSATMH